MVLVTLMAPHNRKMIMINYSMIPLMSHKRLSHCLVQMRSLVPRHLLSVLHLRLVRHLLKPGSFPPYLARDYHCPQAMLHSTPSSPSMTSSKKGTRHPLSNLKSYDKLSPSYHSFVLALSSIPEPTSFTEAVQDPKWNDGCWNSGSRADSDRTCKGKTKKDTVGR